MEMFMSKENEFKLINFIDMTIDDPSFLIIHDDVFSKLSVTCDTEHGLEARIYINYRKSRWDGNIYSPNQDDPLIFITDWRKPVIENREIHYPIIFNIASMKSGDTPKHIKIKPLFKNCYIYLNSEKHVKAKRDLKNYCKNCEFKIIGDV